MVNIMSEEITLETIKTELDEIKTNTEEKLETVDDKLDTIIGILNAHTTTINNILSRVNELSPSTVPSEDSDDTTPTDFKSELQEKINQGLPYDAVKQWIIEKLVELGIYSEADAVIKLFTHKTGDIILEVKVRPYPKWGDCIQFFQNAMGDADYFETSRYDMKNIMWWKLTRNIQMEEMHSTTDIVDDVNEQWGDNDQIDFNN